MDKRNQTYWRTNLKYLGILLPCWCLIALIIPFVFGNWLNSIQVGGMPLGFWFAMQGSMIGFVILIFVYVRLMNKLDDAFESENNDKQ